MKLETLFKTFDLLIDKPNALRPMREIILQLAVRGKLCKQFKGESAKSQLTLSENFRIREGRRGRPDLDDVPFDIPTNWGWVAVGDTMEMVNGKAFKPVDWSSEGIPIIRIQNLNNENASFNRCKVEVDAKFHVHDGDFLISWSGTPGTSFGAFIWNRGLAYLNQHIFRCQLIEGVFLKTFLRLAINARLDEMISHAQGAVGLQHITKGKLEAIRLPLPPLAEQKRIVAKVDELMALCDRLEAQLQERDSRAADLARSSLARFSESPTPSNLNLLFHKSYDITPADLRKSILTLAVQGKLVPQDPKDEPAEVFLKKIMSQPGETTNRAFGDQGGAITPYPLPAGWAWSKFPELGVFGRGKSKHRPRNDPALFTNGVYRLVQTGDVARANGIITTFTSCYNEVGLAQSKMWPAGTLCITIAANIADSGILGFDACFPDSVVGFIPAHPIPSVRYFEYFMRTAKEQLESFAPSTAQKNINLGILEEVLIPIPPLAEQIRIVAKLDQLMALVDDLEGQVAASRATGEELLEAVVADLTKRKECGQV